MEVGFPHIARTFDAVPPLLAETGMRGVEQDGQSVAQEGELASPWLWPWT